MSNPNITEVIVSNLAPYNAAADWSKIPNKPEGLVSSSAQVLAYGVLATTGSNTFNGTQTVTGDINVTGDIAITNGAIQNPESIDFAPTPDAEAPAYLQGRVYYNSDQGSLVVYNDEADIALNVGQEQILSVRNTSGQPILNGTPVFISGSVGNRPRVFPAKAEDHTNIEYHTDHIIGLATHDIEHNSNGYVTTFGVVNGVNTNAFTAGDVLYVSTVSGQLTNVRPAPPIDIIQVGYVVRVKNNGSIFVSPREPIHFKDISAVSGSTNPSNGATWVYDSVKRVWYASNTLPSIVASGSFSGSLIGIATNATQAVTASYVTPTGLPAGTVSASAQVNHNATTNYVANQHIDHTTVSMSAGLGLTGGGNIAQSRTFTVDTGSAHFTNGVKAKMNADAVVSSSAQVAQYGYAITGSNTFVGNQTVSGNVVISGSINATGGLTGSVLGIVTASNAVSASFATTASYVIPSGAPVQSVNGFSGSVILSGSNIPFNGASVGMVSTNVSDGIIEAYSTGLRVVNHGTSSVVERPADFDIVLWRGTAIPESGSNGDLWDETRTFYSPSTALWVYSATDKVWKKGNDWASNDWISIHNTTLRSGSNVIELNLNANTTGSRIIDWGDGVVETINTAFPSHSYATGSTYTVRINGTGTTTRVGERGTSTNAGWTDTLVAVKSWGNLGFTSFANAFTDCSNLTEVPQWVPSAVTNMSSMFARTTVGTNIFSQNLNNWNTSAVTDMNSMFNSATAFNGNIGSWNTGNVTNMSAMFQNASAFNQPLNSWDVSKVTNMSSMFARTTAGTNLFNQDLNSWNTGEVTNMNTTFGSTTITGAVSFNGNISSWNTAKVVTMTQMFRRNAVFNQDISGWNTGAVTNMSFMFQVCLAFNQPIGSWNTGNVTNMQSMLQGATSFNQPLNSWDVSKVTNMNLMFTGASIFNQDLNSWNTSAVTDMGSMFSSAVAFNGNITSWNTGAVTTMASMFVNAYAFNQNIGSWNTGNVTDMSAMFQNATIFDQDISGWDTSKVTTMFEMFRRSAVIGNMAFNQPIGSWDVSAVTTFVGMFRRDSSGTSSFNQDLGAWDLRLAGTNMANMFTRVAGTLSMSTENYSRTLIGWSNYVSANGNTPAAVGLGAGDRTYNSTNYVTGQTYNNAVDARNYLTTGTPAWTITDGGQV